MVQCPNCGYLAERFVDPFCPNCKEEFPHLFKVDVGLPTYQALRRSDILIRIIAALLALGGAFWGFLLLMIFNTEGSASRLSIFILVAGPGYLVTAGYAVRALLSVSFIVRITIWRCSMLVQGAWLIFGVIVPTPLTLWWLLAFVGSIFAASKESRDMQPVGWTD